MEFTNFHKLIFNAKQGAYSVVTQNEAEKAQITITDFEVGIVANYFGYDNIQVGNVRSNKLKASKPFVNHSDNKSISLNVVFPKPNKKTELRLYLNAAFKPKGE